MQERQELVAPESGTAFLLAGIGWATFIVSIVVAIIFATDNRLNGVNGALFGALIGVSIQILITAKVIQKMWDMEFYLRHIANNTYSQIPEYKPINPIPAPSSTSAIISGEDDLSKYAPKK